VVPKCIAVQRGGGGGSLWGGRGREDGKMGIVGGKENDGRLGAQKTWDPCRKNRMSEVKKGGNPGRLTAVGGGKK